MQSVFCVHNTFNRRVQMTHRRLIRPKQLAIITFPTHSIFVTTARSEDAVGGITLGTLEQSTTEVLLVSYDTWLYKDDGLAPR